MELKHVRIVFDEKLNEFRILLVLDIGALIAKLQNTDQAGEPWEDETLHTTTTLEGAIVHANRESQVLAKRLGMKHNLPVILDGSVARKCQADGYTGDPNYEERR